MPRLKAYNAATSQWEYIAVGGQGPAGETGPQGETGPAGPAGSETVVTSPITNSGTLTAPVLGFDDAAFAKLAGATFTGTVTTSNGITNAQQKSALVASGFNSVSGNFAQPSRVIMTAAATASTRPTTRPDGSALVIGDIFFGFS
jgi:hypothetical protein